MRKLSILLILLVFTALFCGCTTPTAPAQTAAPTSLQTVQSAAPAASGVVKNVIIRQKAFDPDIITISPGTTVVWTNEDSFNHRVVHMPDLSNERELFHSDLLTKGDTFRYTFQTAGRYYYSSPQYAGGRKSVVIVE
jgi:plastocyanin